MGCLSPSAVQEYLQALPDDRAGVEEHLDGCDDCRALVAAAAQLSTQGVSRYVLGARIGGGGMGVVYEAHDPELRRRVAVKVLASGAADARLLREAQALARVSHPNVVPIYDVGTQGAIVFLAMELVEGRNLREWLAARPRRVAEILDVLIAAGRGLAAAHAAGLVHRDFKPENVLVGDDGRVRVTDFGLARDQHEAASLELPAAESSDLLAGELTHRGALVGTPVYMAPEQLSGEGGGPRSDQFSFCVTLYEALHGRRPFAAGSIGELRRAVGEGRIPDSAAPRWLRRVFLRGLAARPGDRFPSIDALLDELQRHRAGSPRRLTFAALVCLALAAGVIGLGALRRERATDAARASLEVTSAQLGRALARRYETFSALIKATSALPAIREIGGNFDRAEFGLGEAGADERRLEVLHEHMASADWSMWTDAGASVIAVGDYKGRLLYSSGAPRRFGGDLRALDAVARAYESRGPAAMLLPARDSGLRDAPGDAVLLLLAGAAVPGSLPRAVLVQGLDARAILAEESARADRRLAVVAGDVVVGEPPPEGRGWLVVTRPLPGPGGAPIASLVAGARVDAGLGAAGVGLGAAAGLLAVVLGVRAHRARRFMIATRRR
jgi:predicted Ser/Thr protein kinase